MATSIQCEVIQKINWDEDIISLYSTHLHFYGGQSAEMADSKEDSEEQAKPSVINGHYDYVQGFGVSAVYTRCGIEVYSST